MKRHATALTGIVLTFLVAAGAYAQPEDTSIPVGEMVYLVGTVDVQRNGELIDYWNVDIGLEIEAYDLVQTGSDGQADIELTTPSSEGMSVRISENTAFYFDVNTEQNKPKTKVQMLAGSITMNVKKLVSGGVVEVETPGVVLGVRGTEFTVTSSPEGSFLVTCREGQVECSDVSGSTRYAAAGQVVEKTEDVFREVNVPVSELERYRTDWLAERERVFRAGAPVFIRSFATQYQDYLPRYIDAYRGLIEQREIFQTWAEAYRTGTKISKAKLFQQRRQVTGAIIEARSVFPTFQQLFYRLSVLKRFHDQGIGRTTIVRGLSSTEFFESFAASRREVEKSMARVRFYFKLFGIMTGFSDSSIMDEAFGGNPFEDSGPPAPTDPRNF